MHSDIIQISKTPLEEEDHIGSEDIPEWFVGEIADYIGEQRNYKGAIDTDPKTAYLTSVYPFKAEGDGFVLDREKAEAILSDRCRQMIDNAKILAEMTFDDFVNGNIDQPFYRLSSAVEDKFDVYVYDSDECDLMTFDDWLRRQYRNCDPRFYVGAVLDYHF